MKSRLPVETVIRIDRQFAGDPDLEQKILGYIFEKFGARGLFYIPEHAAKQMLKRPADFVSAVRAHYAKEGND